MNRKLDSILALHEDQILLINCSDLLPDLPLNWKNSQNFVNLNKELRKQFVSIKLFLLKKEF